MGGFAIKRKFMSSGALYLGKNYKDLTLLNWTEYINPNAVTLVIAILTFV